MEINTNANKQEMKDFTRTLKLVEARDGTGINLAVRVKNHAEPKLNKYWYLLRILNDGSILLFNQNSGEIGFKVDKKGQVIIKTKK